MDRLSRQFLEARTTRSSTIELTGDLLEVSAGSIGTTELEDGSVTAAKLAAAVAGNGLTGGAGTALAVNVGTGLEIVTDAVRIAAAAAGNGLSGGAGSALAVNVDGSTLEISSDSLRVKDLGITQAKAATGFRLRAASSAAPGSPSRGDKWTDTDTMEEFSYYGATTGWQLPWNLPWGSIGYAQITAASATITTTEADVSGLSVTFTAVANRRYRTTLYVSTYLGQSVQDEESYAIVTDGSNSKLQEGRMHASLTTKNSMGVNVVYINNATFSAGSRTHKARGKTLSGTTSWFAAAAQPAFIFVEDVGPLSTAPSS